MSTQVTAEMGGTVWKVLTEVGASIEPGSVLMILESMKMEIPVIAEDGGTVESLAVGEGQSVEPGTTLVTMT